MTPIDYLFWAAVLIAAVALVTWYGASWRAVAKALAPAKRPVLEQPVDAPPAEGQPGSPGQGQAADALIFKGCDGEHARGLAVLPESLSATTRSCHRGSSAASPSRAEHQSIG